MTINIGVIGLGNMGSAHCNWLTDHPEFKLVAVADELAVRLQQFESLPSIRCFDSGSALIKRGGCDAVLIATPHLSHVKLARLALKMGLHVLVEKPIASDIADAEKLLGEPKAAGQQLALMFNQRTNPAYQHIRSIITDQRYGRVRRMNWVITDWFRAESYYSSGQWRATWRGEGGGALLNQAPHQLDLLCWLFGRPQSVFADAGFGRWHDIGVEDEVTAILTFASGATGVFVTSTGEAPGVNRLEIVFESATLVYDTKLKNIEIAELEIPLGEAIEHNKAFQKPRAGLKELSFSDQGGQHQEVLDNFADAIQTGAPLIAPGEAGLDSLMLANALILSGATKKMVTLPISSQRYRRFLRAKMREEPTGQRVIETRVTDLSGSFS